jgi:predicted PurR-regulated permease PerM
VLGIMSPERSSRYQRLGTEISRSLAGYLLGDLLTSVIAALVVFVTLELLSVPYALLWALWVGLVDFLPSVGGALAGIPTVLFALTRSFTAAAITAAVFIIYQQFENHVLNPVIMSRTVRVNPLLVMVALLISVDIGNWLGGAFAAFVAALLAIPTAGVVQVVAREIWTSTSPGPAITQDQAVPTGEPSQK